MAIAGSDWRTAARLMFTIAPTVTATLHRMMRDGLITMDDHKAVHLTETGREQAESIVRRHALAERLGVAVVVNGVNADDLADYRPGTKAAGEHRVAAELRGHVLHHPARAERLAAAHAVEVGLGAIQRGAAVGGVAQREMVARFLEPAAHLPERRFLIGGNGWHDKAMTPNVRNVGHVYTRDHNAFNCTPLAVLNISRESMARYGFSPATRVFEAAGAMASKMPSSASE